MTDRLTHEKEAIETTYQQAKRDLDRLRVDVKEYQRQFTQRQQSSTAGDDLDHAREVMVKKNREISEYLDELKNLQVNFLRCCFREISQYLIGKFL